MPYNYAEITEAEAEAAMCLNDSFEVIPPTEPTDPKIQPLQVNQPAERPHTAYESLPCDDPDIQRDFSFVNKVGNLLSTADGEVSAEMYPFVNRLRVAWR